MPSKKRSDSKIAEVWFVLALKEKDPRKQGKWSTTLNPAMMWFGKGVAFCELGEYEEAIWCFDKALKINPRYIVTWTGKGYAFYKLRKNAMIKA